VRAAPRVLEEMLEHAERERLAETARAQGHVGLC
jgi:hypothetical protein